MRGPEIELRDIIEGEVNGTSSGCLDNVLEMTVNTEPVLEVLFRCVRSTRDLLGESWESAAGGPDTPDWLEC